MRVLLADADDVFLEIAQSFLWDRGHEAEIAADGLECVSILREFAPHVLVLDRDLLWGGSDGVLDWISKDPLLCETPIILTVNGEFGEEVMALSRLPAACLQKPYRLGELAAEIDEAGRCASQQDSIVDFH